VPGITRMRVTLSEQTSAFSVLPCMAGDVQGFYYGETEDYAVEIIAATPCSGMPDPVTITGPTHACPGTPFTLTATGNTFGVGIEYQWQYDDNGTWTDIVGATGISYTEASGITALKDYRFITTCTNGGDQDISAVYTVDLEPFYHCYCSSYAYYVYD